MPSPAAAQEIILTQSRQLGLGIYCLLTLIILMIAILGYIVVVGGGNMADLGEVEAGYAKIAGGGFLGVLGLLSFSLRGLYKARQQLIEMLHRSGSLEDERPRVGRRARNGQ